MLLLEYELMQSHFILYLTDRVTGIYTVPVLASQHLLTSQFTK